MNMRQAYHRRYYLEHHQKYLDLRRTNYELTKSDPVAYNGLLEKARLYKRERFGWKRTYHIKRKDASVPV